MAEEIIKIANCSGYYGDKLSAAKEMVEGGPIDVLTGDYLAELTMAILYSQKLQRGEDKGYVGTFLKQLKEVAKMCKDKNIKIISNAGGLNPKSMAKEVDTILTELAVDATVAYIQGDDLIKDLEELQTEGETFENMDRKYLWQNLAARFSAQTLTSVVGESKRHWIWEQILSFVLESQMRQ